MYSHSPSRYVDNAAASIAWPVGNSGELGRFMIELAKGRYPDQQLFRNAEMRKLVKEL